MVPTERELYATWSWIETMSLTGCLSPSALLLHRFHVVCKSELPTSYRFSGFSSLDRWGQKSKGPEFVGGTCTARFRFDNHVLNVCCISGTLWSILMFFI